MQNLGDARGAGKSKTLIGLLLIVALFFVGSILRRWIWP